MRAARVTTVLAAAAIAACASASSSDVPDAAVPDAAVDAPGTPPIDAAPTPISLSQTTSMAIGSNNSIACGNNDGTTAENSWYRVFRLADAGITGGLRINSVTFGVQEALGMPTVQVKVGTYAGTVQPSPTQLDTALITPIASASFTVPNTTNTATRTVTVPITANVPALSQLVVEIAAPDLNGQSKYFYLGGNNGGESKPAYLRAPTGACATPQPKTTSSLGFPDAHLVITVDGTH